MEKVNAKDYLGKIVEIKMDIIIQMMLSELWLNFKKNILNLLLKGSVVVWKRLLLIIKSKERYLFFTFSIFIV